MKSKDSEGKANLWKLDRNHYLHVLDSKKSPSVKAMCLVGVFFVLSFWGTSMQLHAQYRIYELWDDQPAPNRGADFSGIRAQGFPYDEDWEKESYCIGNGYVGVNAFGRTDVERIQITDKTLYNEGLWNLGGLTSFAEIYLDFDHTNYEQYKRSLNLNEGILYVSYVHEGISYQREYLANYPENVVAIKLSANQKNKLSFTVSAEIPYLRSTKEKNTKIGTIVAKNDLITLAGNIPHFSQNYEGQIKVIPQGGTLTTRNLNDRAEIQIKEANTVTILITTGTNYQLEPQVFLGKNLDEQSLPQEEVSGRIARATQLGYKNLKNSHLKDYQNLFERVSLQLATDVPNKPTRDVLKDYRAGSASPYLEELMFHFGRYLLIASSREGALPSGLQGAWSQYAVTPWTGGYWHNINVQMNYLGGVQYQPC